MFIVLYRFEVIPGKIELFQSAWKDLTDLIYTYEGSLGSRLHRESEHVYIAYAQWPSKEVFENSGNLPDSANVIRARMREACKEITRLHEMDVVLDLLEKTTSTGN